MLKDKRLEIVTEIHRQLDLTFAEVHAMTEDRSLPAKTFLIARIIAQAANAGDPMRANFIFENALAPVPKAVSFVDEDGKAYRPLQGVSTQDLLSFYQALQKKKASK